MTAQRQERKAWHRVIAVIAVLAGCAAPTHGEFAAQAATTERVVVNRNSGLAISGFDPVAYFTDSEPKLGLPDFELTRDGVVWRFCNPDNMGFFIARPDIYAPQFGGYDPVDVARGVAVAGSPWFFTVLGQRLFLFAREESRDAFAADPATFFNEARHRWPDLQETLAE
jgi:YHS domain-containing protein